MVYHLVMGRLASGPHFHLRRSFAILDRLAVSRDYGRDERRIRRFFLESDECFGAMLFDLQMIRLRSMSDGTVALALHSSFNHSSSGQRLSKGLP
jgi:hypothetical protein